jgi:tetratricopeptide (TPR) repeat protein
LALDREDTLKKAEKLLRQGRLDAAIAEYVRVVEDQPRDWTTANTLGDLYARAGQAAKAVSQYGRIADHFYEDGFYPKAAALYKKVLKLTPDDEGTQLKLAEISAQQGLLLDAKSYFNAVLARRRARNDQTGSDELVIRLGDLDPGDLEARKAAARVLAAMGDGEAAAARFRALHDDLRDKGRNVEALDALREAVALDPSDKAARGVLAKVAIADQDFERAREYLDRDTAGSDPDLLVALVDMELRSGRLETAREILPQLFAIDRDRRKTIVELAWALSPGSPPAAFVCIEADVNASMAAGDYEDAAAVLQEFVARVPDQVPAFLKLIEVCVDGGLESTMYETQAQLADAYLAAGQAAEARVIAEDLVAREPWERSHIERFRRALVMLRVPEPDSVIAERLSGHSPFTATDLFSEPIADRAPPAEAVSEAPVEGDVADEGDEGDVDPVAHAGLPSEPEPPVPPEERPEPFPPSPPPAPPPPSPRPPERQPSMEIDLTSALGDLQAAPVLPPPADPAPPSLDAIFKGIRGDAAAQPEADEAGQHLGLARTYLEMGMVDEAMGSLESAARAPRHRFIAASLLGHLYRDQGDPMHAIEWLERAAEAPAPSEGDGHALLYDLGNLLELIGETARALAVFLELRAAAGDYKDVAARVDHLSRVQTGG